MNAAREKRLREILRALPDSGQEALLQFAEFLLARARDDGAQPARAERRALARPPGESVVAALKRLNADYYMLDTEPLLPETSALMAEHLMQGRPAAEVIDRLEQVFARHYARLAGSAEP